LRGLLNNINRNKLAKLLLRMRLFIYNA